ncbi:MAG: HD domain-containing phosphohydrolase [Actinomycetota bacterium]
MPNSSFMDGTSRQVLVGVVDTSEKHRVQVEQALTSFYRVASWADTGIAMTALRKTPPCAVVVDRGAGPQDALDFVREMRRDPVFTDVPVIFTSNGEDGGIRGLAATAGADAFLLKPYRRSALIGAITQQINRAVERKWDTLPTLQRSALVNTMDVFNSISDVIEKGEPIAYASVTQACGPLVEAVGMREYKGILNGVRDHDNVSYAHSLGMATLLLLFGYTIGLKGNDLSLLGSAGLLHDVGKMSIPHEVLNKPGSLTGEEFERMKSHVAVTVDYLRKCDDLPRNVLMIAEQHHERLDGSGYPSGLKGAELNELSRMAAIVDVFCALSDRRVYRPAMDAEDALHVMTEEMPGKLDMQLLSLFRDMLLDART